MGGGLMKASLFFAAALGILALLAFLSQDDFHIRKSRQLLQLQTESEDSISLGPHGEIIETSTYTMSNGYAQLAHATHTATTHISAIHKAATKAASSLMDRIKHSLHETGEDPDAADEASSRHWFSDRTSSKEEDQDDSFFAPVKPAKKDAKGGFSYHALKEDDEDPDADDDSVDEDQLKKADEASQTPAKGNDRGWLMPGKEDEDRNWFGASSDDSKKKEKSDKVNHWFGAAPRSPSKPAPETKTSSTQTPPAPTPKATAEVLPKKAVDVVENPMGAPSLEDEPSQPVTTRWLYFENHKIFVVTVLSCLAVLAMIIAFVVGKYVSKRSRADLEAQYAQVSTVGSPEKMSHFTGGSEEQV